MTKHKTGETRAERKARRIIEHNRKVITEHKIEEFQNLYDKLVLYQIMYKWIPLGEKEPRYDFTDEFLGHIKIVHESCHLYSNLNLREFYEELTSDFKHIVHVVSRYLAMERK